MESAKYIGRVGALAVALGIGAAIASLPGVAWAETDTKSSETASADSATSKSQSPGDKAAGRDEAKPADDEPGTPAEKSGASVDVDRDDTDADNDADEATDIDGARRQTVTVASPVVGVAEEPSPLPGDPPPRPVEAPVELALAAVGTRQRQPAAAVPSASAPVAAAPLTAGPPIPVGTNPTAIVIGTAPNGNRVFVANTGSSSVSVIDAATGQRIDANPSWLSKDIRVGSAPSALAISADGTRLYVANRNSNSVSVIDAATFARIDANPSWLSKDIKVGSAPNALALSADGTRLYVANRNGNSVSVISTATNGVAGTVAVGNAPSAMVIGTDGRLYVANRNGNSVSVISTATNSVTGAIAVGTAPSAVAFGSDGRLYVANTGGGSLSVIDTVANPVAVKTISTGPSPSSVALSPDGKFAYVANGNDTVSTIDTATDQVLSTVAFDTDATGAHSIAVSSTGTVYVTDAADRTVRTLTATDGQEVSAIGSITITGNRPGSLRVNADGTRAVLVTSYPIGPVSWDSSPDGIYGSTTRVAVIDTASGGQVGSTFAVTGTTAATVQLSADGTRVLITFGHSDTRVAVLDTATGAQIGSTLTLTGSGSAQFIANSSRALITTAAVNSSASTTTRVAVLNTATGKQLGATLALAGNIALEVSPDGAHAVLFTEAKVAAINTTTGVTSTAALTGPWQLTRWSADGSRAVISSRNFGAAGTTRVAVIDSTTAAQIGTTLTVDGDGGVQPGNGTRALITTKVTNAGTTTTRIAAFDTTTGTQIGTTLVLTGDGTVVTSGDGGRALVASDIYNSATASHSTALTVFNVATGTQIGTTLTLTGGLLYGVEPTFGPNGTRAVITTDVYDPATKLHTSRVTTIATATGTKIGDTLAFVGPDPVKTTWRADGIHALLTMTTTPYSPVITPTLVAVLNTMTGTQVGATLSVAGTASQVYPMVSPSGDRALIITDDHADGTVRVTTVDTTTGAQLGSATTLNSVFSGRIALSPNADRAIIIAGDQVAVLNTATGAQVGATFTAGDIATVAMFSTNGDRVLIAASNDLTVIDTATGTKVGSTFTLTDTVPRQIVTLPTADGTHVVVTTDRRYIGDSAVPATPVAVIDLSTGTRLGTTLTLIGDTYALPAITLNGTRALVATAADDLANGVSTTRVTTINTVTGMPTGSTVTLDGVLASGVGNPLGVVVSPDGARALIATTDPAGTRTSRVAVIDAATGMQIGDVVTISGSLSGLRWSSNGTRVFVTIYITTALGSDLNIRETVLRIA